MVTYEEFQKLKKEIGQKHETSEHTKEADVVVLTSYKKVYQGVQESLEATVKAWKPEVKFRHATNACDAFWTRKGVSIFITDYFLHADFSIFGPDPIGDDVAKLYREDEDAIVAIVSPYFNDYTPPLDYRTERYLWYWQEFYTRNRYCRPWGVGSPSEVSLKLNHAGFRSFGVDEKGMDDLREYIKEEIDKNCLTKF